MQNNYEEESEGNEEPVDENNNINVEKEKEILNKQKNYFNFK